MSLIKLMDKIIFSMQKQNNTVYVTFIAVTQTKFVFER